jgi:hypothetical protein
MAEDFHFIEIKAKDETCYYCGRRQVSDSDHFYRVLLGDNPLDIIVCEFCRAGFMITALEGKSKSFAAHFTFYIKRSIFELKESYSKDTTQEIECCLEDYEAGNYAACIRSIGLLAEHLTNKLFTEKFGKSIEYSKLSWDTKLGKLLDFTRKNQDAPENNEETAIYQLYSLKWFRNKADHPSEYKLTAEDARLALISLDYLIHSFIRQQLSSFSPEKR